MYVCYIICALCYSIDREEQLSDQQKTNETKWEDMVYEFNLWQQVKGRWAQIERSLADWRRFITISRTTTAMM